MESCKLNKDENLAMGISSYKTKEEEICKDEKMFVQKIYDIKCQGKIRKVQMLNRKTDKHTIRRVKSYHEMMQGILEKEDLTKVKVAETLLPMVRAECVQFIQKWA